MKTKIILIFTILTIISVFNLSAQVDVLEGGNVGIGNLAPQYKLDVNGSINFTDSLYLNGVLYMSLDKSLDIQTLDLDGNTLSISGSNSVTLPEFTDTDTDDQTLNISDNTLSISEGNSVTLPEFKDTDDQTLNLDGNTLSISEGNSVVLPTFIDTDTDNQTLNLEGNSLSISEGNSIDLGSFSSWSPNDLKGGIFSNKQVAIKKPYPEYDLDVGGDINFSGLLLKDGKPIDMNGSMWTKEGEAAVYEGNVGIGTYSPEALLQVKSSDNNTTFSVGEKHTSVANNTGLSISPWSNGNVYIDSKVRDGGKLHFRYGEGDEGGASNLWATMEKGKFGIGTSSPQAALDISSSLSGFLPPRMTTDEKSKIENPIPGMMVYDKDLNCMALFDGNAWGCLQFKYSEKGCKLFQNIALTGKTSQSSTYGNYAHAARAIDNNTSGNWRHNSVTHTYRDRYAWWQIDLGESKYIEKVNLFNRTDCCSNRLSNFYIIISDHPISGNNPSEIIANSEVYSTYHTGSLGSSKEIEVKTSGRYVRVQLNRRDYLSLAEVQIIGCK